MGPDPADQSCSLLKFDTQVLVGSGLYGSAFGPINERRPTKLWDKGELQHPCSPKASSGPFSTFVGFSCFVLYLTSLPRFSGTIGCGGFVVLLNIPGTWLVLVG